MEDLDKLYLIPVLDKWKRSINSSWGDFYPCLLEWLLIIIIIWWSYSDSIHRKMPAHLLARSNQEKRTQVADLEVRDAAPRCILWSLYIVDMDQDTPIWPSPPTLYGDTHHHCTGGHTTQVWAEIPRMMLIMWQTFSWPY